VLESTSIVYCELSTGNCRRYGYDPGEVEQLLADAGFVFIRTDAARQLAVTPDPYLADLESDQLPATGYNLVAVRPDVANELLERLSVAGWTHA
jgi:hypothetical protein